MVKISDVKENTHGHYIERLEFLEKFGIVEEDISNVNKQDLNKEEKRENFKITFLYQPKSATVFEGNRNSPYKAEYFNIRIIDIEKNITYYFNYMNNVLTEYHIGEKILFEYNYIENNKFKGSTQTSIFIKDVIKDVLGITIDKEIFYLNGKKISSIQGKHGFLPPKEESIDNSYPLKNTYFIKSGDCLKVEPVEKTESYLKFKHGETIYYYSFENSTNNYDYGYKRILDYINNSNEKQEQELVECLDDEIDENPVESKSIQYPKYTKEDFLSEVYMTEEDYVNIINVLSYKKNLLLQGAPGVGKTYLAERLAYVMLKQENNNRILKVQFHQNYSYEEFICGYKAVEDGFRLEYGIFYDFCKKAENDPDNDYFFIIDEVNRGNLSKIFGEVFMLIESDKRGDEVQLMYDKEEFSIPENLYIIGTMNTADRSIALIDYALRRRFSFYTLSPAFDSEQFKKYASTLDSVKFDNLINIINELNEDISNDELLGEEFNIGHSYFCNLKKSGLNNTLKTIIEYEIIPLINEYWFDNKDKFEEWSSNLRSVLDD